MENPHVLIKHGMYYGHNSCGYTARFELAEIFEQEDAEKYAEGHEDIIAKSVFDLITNKGHLQEYINRMAIMQSAYLNHIN